MNDSVVTCSINVQHIVLVVFIACLSFCLISLNNKLNSNLEQNEQLLAEKSSKHPWLNSLRTELSEKQHQLSSIEEAVNNAKTQNDSMQLEIDRFLHQYEVNNEN